MRTITAKQIAQAIGVSEDTIYRREGLDMPLPVNPGSKPKAYDLRAVLISLKGAERERVASKCGYSVTIVISEREEKAFDPKQVYPNPDSEDPDAEEDLRQKQEEKRDRFF